MPDKDRSIALDDLARKSHPEFIPDQQDGDVITFDRELTEAAGIKIGIDRSCTQISRVPSASALGFGSFRIGGTMITHQGGRHFAAPDGRR